MKVRLLKKLRMRASILLELHYYGAKYSKMAGSCRYVLVRRDNKEFMANGNYILSEVEAYRKKKRKSRQEYKIIKLE